MNDNAWKVATFVTATIVIPLFGWVWNTHTQLNSLRTEYEYTKTSVQKMEENTTEIKLMQRDLQHMNQKIDELMVLVVKMSKD
jgi:hypothetical protein